MFQVSWLTILLLPVEKGGGNTGVMEVGESNEVGNGTSTAFFFSFLGEYRERGFRFPTGNKLLWEVQPSHTVRDTLSYLFLSFSPTKSTLTDISFHIFSSDNHSFLRVQCSKCSRFVLVVRTEMTECLVNLHFTTMPLIRMYTTLKLLSVHSVWRSVDIPHYCAASVKFT